MSLLVVAAASLACASTRHHDRPSVAVPKPAANERLIVYVIVRVASTMEAAAEVRALATRLGRTADDQDRVRCAYAPDIEQLEIRGDGAAFPVILDELRRLGPTTIDRAETRPMSPAERAEDSDEAMRLDRAMEARGDVVPEASRERLRRIEERLRRHQERDDGRSSLMVVALVGLGVDTGTTRVHGVGARDLQARSSWAGGGVTLGGRLAAFEALVLTDAQRTTHRSSWTHLAGVLTPRHEGQGTVSFLNPYGTFGMGVSVLDGPKDRTEAYVPLGLGVEWVRGQVVSFGTEVRVPLYFASGRGLAASVSPMLTLELRL